MGDEMKGQYSMFDLTPLPNAPCNYKFQRYIGQKVRMMIDVYPVKIVHGVITKIDTAYYTTVDVDGKEYVGTPYNLSED